MTKPSVLTNALPAQAAGTNPPVAMPSLAFDRILAVMAAASCIGLLVYKFALIRMLNVNWDEFFFLKHVHDLARGELKVVLQGAYTHLFSWLPLLPGDEMQQMVAARSVMLAFLVLTAWLVWRLARVWLQGFSALVAPFVYLSMMAVLEHGGSFRADSMLAPLSVAVLLVLVAPGYNSRRDWLAGVLGGVACAVTVKVVLFAPLILASVLFRRQSPAALSRVDWRDALRTMARVAAAGTIVAAVLIGLHRLTISPVPSDSVTGFAVAAVNKTLLDVPWFPRLDYFLRYFDWQPFHWLMIGLGAVIALARRRFDLAALALSLLPLAFYRNAFPYYYVVMLAPASVFAGYAVSEIRSLVRLRASGLVAMSLIATIWAGLLFQGLRFTRLIAFDDQVLQRQIIAAVHEIFPDPVNYVDRCGMVASFRKVNLFMTTWGMEQYRSQNVPFMPRILRDDRPAFVLLNAPALNPAYPGPLGILDEDRDLLGRYFVPYWGPILVAGVRGAVQSSGSVTATVPYPADYRLVTAEPIMVNGALHSSGDVIAVPTEGVVLSRATVAQSEATPFTLFLASAKNPPRDEPAPGVIFRGL